jgi:hypothetical protein
VSLTGTWVGTCPSTALDTTSVFENLGLATSETALLFKWLMLYATTSDDDCFGCDGPSAIGTVLPKGKSLLDWSLQQSTGPNGGPTTQQSTD